MTPRAALLARVGNRDGAAVRTSEIDVRQWPAEAVSALQAHRLLVRARPARTVVCPGCEADCAMPVQTIPAGPPAAVRFIVCDKRSDINRVALTTAHVDQWKCDAEALARFVVEPLGLRRFRPSNGPASTTTPRTPRTTAPARRHRRVKGEPRSGASAAWRSTSTNRSRQPGRSKYERDREANRGITATGRTITPSIRTTRTGRSRKEKPRVECDQIRRLVTSEETVTYTPRCQQGAASRCDRADRDQSQAESHSESHPQSHCFPSKRLSPLTRPDTYDPSTGSGKRRERPAAVTVAPDACGAVCRVGSRGRPKSSWTKLHAPRTPTDSQAATGADTRQVLTGRLTAVARTLRRQPDDHSYCIGSDGLWPPEGPRRSQSSVPSSSGRQSEASRDFRRGLNALSKPFSVDTIQSI